MWAEEARQLLQWSKPFTNVQGGSFIHGDVTWFSDGTLNASVNCVDRHAETRPESVAIIWEGDEPGNNRYISYADLRRDICRLANAFINLGLRRGDSVAIYMPMIPEAAVAMLACARLGVVHSVVFAGFSADALRDRIIDGNAKLIVTADHGCRAGRLIPLKNTVDAALETLSFSGNVLVFQRHSTNVHIKPGRDIWWHDLVPKQRPFCPPVDVSAEDPLFMLYTSGSTGKPKGVVHTTAGYLLYAAITLKTVFDIQPGDIFGCMADVGWITGHSYIVYGPLLLGITTVMFESIPTYPSASRYWDVIDRLGITQFYTAPTAIRALRKLGPDYVKPFSLKTLRVLGSVGEPINPEAWNWYNDNVGRGKCPIVDTYWQTETGGHVITPLPGMNLKPGSAMTPFHGIELALLDPRSGSKLEGNDVEGILVICQPWPGMARTIHGDHNRFMETYFQPYPGYYFCGDSAYRDSDGHYWIRGRVDDVINVSGHRMSTAEIESALITHPDIAEAAVIAMADELTGQAIGAFCTLKSYSNDISLLREYSKDFVAHVRKCIGPIATPKRVIVVQDLPKTRSGKIMRRILRKILAHEYDSLGDLSTLTDPEIIPVLIDSAMNQ